MLSRGGDPGAPVALWSAVFALLAILAFVARHKWRKAVERSEEVRRLVEIAAAEAARTEWEAEVAWRSKIHRPVEVVSGGGREREGLREKEKKEKEKEKEKENEKQKEKEKKKQCAACSNPTTTRCSRCKVVFYCSGRCQIIHWRLGHKDECRPPDDIKCNGPEGGQGLDSAHSLTSEFSGTWDNFSTKFMGSSLGSHASSHSSFSSSIFHEDEKIGNVLTGEDGFSQPSIASSGSSTPIHIEKPDAASKNIEGRQFSLHSLSTSESGVEVSILADSRSQIPHCTPGSTSLNEASHSCQLTRKPSYESVSTSNSRGLERHDDESQAVTPYGQDVTSASTLKSNTVLGDPHLLKARNKESLENKPPRISLNKSVDPCSSQQLSETHVDSQRRGGGLVTATPESNKDGHELKASGPPLDTDTAEHCCSDTGNFVSGSIPPPSTNDAAQPGKPIGKPSSAMIGSSNLKASVRKAAQQFMQSKPPSLGKMLFPHELFVKLYNEKVELHPCGFTNLGNSCFANVVLQCLVFTRPLAAYLLQGLHKKKCRKKDWCFICEFEGLVVEVKRGKSPLAPVGILSQIHNIGSHLTHGKQEDAHEFLRYAIDAMQRVCLKESGADELGKFAEETSLIQLIFGGYLRSKIKCLKCNVKSERQERMMDLTVEIQGDIENLHDALRGFTSTELLDGENRYSCDRCKSYERAKKKLTVAEAPNILTIVLKRFQTGKFGKINKPVKFPKNLDLTPYLSNPSDTNSSYDLYAVVVHVGVMNASFSGHYVCYVKNFQGKWFKADDSTVKPVDVERVLSKGAYMLLYARCLPRVPSLVQQQPSNISKNSRPPNGGLTSGHSWPNPVARSASSRIWSEFNPPDYQSSRFFSSRHIRMDSSSDNSSIWSSDEGSCSTVSTRDSTSTDDSGNFSPSRSSDSDCPSYITVPERHPSRGNSNEHTSLLRRGESSTSDCGHPSQGESRKMGRVSYFSGIPGENPSSILPSDKSKHCRKLTEQCSGRETDRANGPFGSRSSSLTRRPTRDKTSQAFS